MDIGKIENRLGLLADNVLRSINGEKFMKLSDYGQMSKKAMAAEPGISRPALYMRETMITKKDILDRLISFVIISDLAFDLFDGDEEKTMQWLMAPNPVFFNFSPFQMALAGRAQPVLEKMREWLGDAG